MAKRDKDGLWGLILFLAVVLTYSPALWAGFIWDDDSMVTANPDILGPLGLREIWTTNAADICPLTLTTFWAEYKLWGLSPSAYHLVTILFHGACAIFLWRVLLRLEVPGAWVGAALWALHPVMVESVAWISEMKNTQSGLFFLLSVLFFLRSLKADIGWNYALTLIFAALALASKSSTVILPLVLCLCAWWREGRLMWRDLTRVIPVFIMSFAAGLVSIWTQNLNGADDLQWARSWPERLLAAGDAIWFYVSKLFWPHPLIMVYPRWRIDEGQILSYVPLLAVIIIFLIFWLNRGLWSRSIFFVFAYFLVSLLPALGLIDTTYSRYSLVADHFQYLASMGPLALMGAGFARLADIVIPGRLSIQTLAGSGLLLLFATLSWQQCRVYENQEKLWTYTLAWNPACWAGHNNLGNALIQKGRVEEGITHLQEALALNPNDAEAHSNLGNILAQNGRLGEAIVQFQEALVIHPDYGDARGNLGLALLQVGRLDEAIIECEKEVELKPNYDIAHNNLGFVLLRKGRWSEALGQLQTALAINPNNYLAHYNLGLVFQQQGQITEAVTQFQETLRLRPDFGVARDNLIKAQAMSPK